MTMTNATILKRPALTLPDCLLELLPLMLMLKLKLKLEAEAVMMFSSVRQTDRQTNRQTDRQRDYRRTGQRRTGMADDGYVASLPDSRQTARERGRDEAEWERKRVATGLCVLLLE